MARLTLTALWAISCFSAPVFAQQEFDATVAPGTSNKSKSYYIDLTYKGRNPRELEWSFVEYLEKKYNKPLGIFPLGAAIDGIDWFENCIVLHLNAVYFPSFPTERGAYVFSFVVFNGEDHRNGEKIAVNPDSLIFSDPFVCAVRDASINNPSESQEDLFECARQLLEHEKGKIDGLEAKLTPIQPWIGCGPRQDLSCLIFNQPLVGDGPLNLHQSEANSPEGSWRAE